VPSRPWGGKLATPTGRYYGHQQRKSVSIFTMPWSVFFGLFLESSLFWNCLPSSTPYLTTGWFPPLTLVLLAHLPPLLLQPTYISFKKKRERIKKTKQKPPPIYRYPSSRTTHSRTLSRDAQALQNIRASRVCAHSSFECVDRTTFFPHAPHNLRAALTGSGDWKGTWGEFNCLLLH